MEAAMPADMINQTYFGDCRDTMRALIPNGVKVQCCVTSPPYFGLRDYGHPGQIGLEQTPAEYVAAMVEVFGLVRELLVDDGVLWLNLGDSYANDTKWGGSSGGKHVQALHGATGIGRGKRDTGLKAKDLVGIPWRVAFALQEAGWYLRQDIIWHKPNPMPESVTDRCTKAHEYVFLLSKNARYFWDVEAMKEKAVCAGQHISTNGNDGMCGGYDGHRTRDGLRRGVVVADDRNRRSVWTVATKPYSGAHFATFPPALIEPMILAGSRPGDIVLDPFMGSGTTGQVAQALGRKWIGCELNSDYGPLQKQRTSQGALGL
jgi:DNA modification methylase